jgi:hypothetical protein
VLSEQLGGPLRGGYFSYPATQVVLVVAQLELGVFGLPRLAVGDDGQVVYKADDEVVIEAAVELPAGVGETPFYLFLVHLPLPPPPFPLRTFYRVPVRKVCWCREDRLLLERWQRDRSSRIPKTSEEGVDLCPEVYALDCREGAFSDSRLRHPVYREADCAV